MELTKEILDYIDDHRQEGYELLLELAQIPSPSNHEEKRAAFCKAWLDNQGAVGVYIDEALNVLYPIGCTESNDLVVFMAHSDVVFPDTEPLPLRVEGDLIYCPGVGDDTANVAAVLMTAKYIAENKLMPKDCGVLLVINSGEEGLGNLKGSRKIMEDFGSRVREFVTLDGRTHSCVNRAVGSKRYRIEIDTEGGHSYANFGNRNAIAILASMIDRLYTMEVPPIGKTTYNVGTISGGTSVNTIAQHAEMLYEFRSDEREALAIMQNHLDTIVESYRAQGISVTVTLVGDRPCAAPVDEVKMTAMIQRAEETAQRRYGHGITCRSGSTDCNIPLAMGIPSLSLGCYRGEGAHTREEYVEASSLHAGLQFAYDLILYHF